MTEITKEFIKALPKTDLHLHLDGSLRLNTLIELAKEYNVQLPSYTEEGLMDLVFKERYESLPDYLRGFQYTVGVLKSESALERVAYELALDNQAEGVRYFEVRFAPQLHEHKYLSSINAMKAVHRGLNRAKEEFNSRPEVRDGLEPPFNYGIIVCAMRMFDYGFSEYFDRILDVHRYSKRKWIFSLASQELVRAAIKARDEYGVPVVAVDLAGAEAGYPPADHREAFQMAHEHFLKKTVHAGEAYGPESIFQAITELHADRIGHGFYLFDENMVTDPVITDKSQYVDDLVQYIADRRITIEICLTSNLQTNPKLTDLSQHSFQKMLDAKLSTTICTDNRLVSRTTVTDEVEKAVKTFDIDIKTLKNILIYGFKRSFYPGRYTEKRRYVRSIIDYYEKLARQYGIMDTPAES